MRSLRKRMKQRSEQFRWNLWSLIADRDGYPGSIPTLFLNNDYLDRGARVRIGGGIGQKVFQHLLDAVTVGGDHQFVGGLHLVGIVEKHIDFLHSQGLCHKLW